MNAKRTGKIANSQLQVLLAVKSDVSNDVDIKL